MSELNLSDDPYIFWASAWVNEQEAAAATCPRCSKLARWADRLIVATAVATLAWNVFILCMFGVI
jgi:hypothetical protein